MDDQEALDILYAASVIAAIQAEQVRLLLLQEIYRQHIATLTQALRYR